MMQTARIDWQVPAAPAILPQFEPTSAQNSPAPHLMPALPPQVSPPPAIAASCPSEPRETFDPHPPLMAAQRDAPQTIADISRRWLRFMSSLLGYRVLLPYSTTTVPAGSVIR
jgi:hypothetical protein